MKNSFEYIYSISYNSDTIACNVYRNLLLYIDFEATEYFSLRSDRRSLYVIAWFVLFLVFDTSTISSVCHRDLNVIIREAFYLI